MKRLSANQLAFVSAVIARSAASHPWTTTTLADGDTPRPAIEEVQCLQVGTQLFIAGNHSEHADVAAYLETFGVKDDDTFADCIRYSHWLLSLPTGDRMEWVGENYTVKYSEQEKAAIALADEPPFPALSRDQQEKAQSYFTGAKAPNSPLAWFLFKFVGRTPPVRTGPLFARSTTGALGSVGPNGLYTSKSSINVLAVSGGVHAELKLLRMVTWWLMNDQALPTPPTFTLGGLKKKCSFCSKWIDCYRVWLTRQDATATLALPTGDSRAVGGGAGKRPLLACPGRYGDYTRALFNGADNDKCADVELLASSSPL